MPRKKVISHDEVAITVSKEEVKPKKVKPVKAVRTSSKQQVVKVESSDVLSVVPIHSSSNAQKKISRTRRIKKKKRSAEEAKEIVPIISPSVKLALLSPFRFPLDSAKMASQMARVSGVFFVLIGAVCALLNMNMVIGGEGNTAQVGSTQYNCTDPGSPNYNQTYCTLGTIEATATINQTPAIDVVIDTNSPMSGIVPVNVYVERATAVTLHAYYKNGATSMTLGTAVKVNETMWRFYWDTKRVNDGEYKLKVLVTNSFGSYDHIESSYVTVENYPVETTTNSQTDGVASTQNETTTLVNSGTATGTVTIISTTPTTTSTESLVTLQGGGGSALTGVVPFTIKGAGGTQAKLLMRKEGDSSFSLLGYAPLVSAGTWRFLLDTTKYANGEYVLKAQVVFPLTSKTSNVLPILIQHGGTQSKTTAETTEEGDTANELLEPTILTDSITEELEPDIIVIIAEPDPLKGDVDVSVDVPGAAFVEVYALPENALTPIFLGLAQKQSEVRWRFMWRTTQSPNNVYIVFARAKHKYGISESSRIKAVVQNEIVTKVTPEEIKQIETYRVVNTEVTDSIIDPDDPTSSPPPPGVPQITLTPLTAIMNDIEVTPEEYDGIVPILESFKGLIDADLELLARAVRENDAEMIAEIKARIQKIKEELLTTVPLSIERKEILTKIDEHLTRIVHELEELTVRNETMIKNRIGDAVLKDSDYDGISDYDEVNLYDTDPFAADSDADGFTDGAEIRSGFDPKNPKGETLVAFESPRESGITNENLFQVTAISALRPRTEDEVVESEIAPAIISGTGLPNSFVTLYIFSTPIVVTVKTDDDGAWSYIFDKELEDGEHEIYVGITDNAGRIVAKSNPFSFVKTAEAYAQGDERAADPVIVESEAPSLLSSHMMLVVGSIAVVALGLVLILLGLHVNTRRVLEPLPQ